MHKILNLICRIGQGDGGTTSVHNDAALPTWSPQVAVPLLQNGQILRWALISEIPVFFCWIRNRKVMLQCDSFSFLIQDLVRRSWNQCSIIFNSKKNIRLQNRKDPTGYQTGKVYFSTLLCWTSFFLSCTQAPPCRWSVYPCQNDLSLKTPDFKSLQFSHMCLWQISEMPICLVCLNGTWVMRQQFNTFFTVRTNTSWLPVQGDTHWTSQMVVGSHTGLFSRSLFWALFPHFRNGQWVQSSHDNRILLWVLGDAEKNNVLGDGRHPV